VRCDQSNLTARIDKNGQIDKVKERAQRRPSSSVQAETAEEPVERSQQGMKEANAAGAAAAAARPLLRRDEADNNG